jgi:predicted GNAT family N-acyltransferase
MEIKEISAAETYLVRLPVLRKGKTIERCAFEGDTFKDTVHFGYFENNNLIGVISIFQKNNIAFSEEKQFQIRGMAVLENFQKRGIGNLLVEKAINYCQEKNGNLIWFNARETAVEFYKKMSFEINGTGFVIKDIGLHFVMFKRI